MTCGLGSVLEFPSLECFIASMGLLCLVVWILGWLYYKAFEVLREWVGSCLEVV